jgi:hypothetical protein
MPHVATASLRDHVADELLAAVARLSCTDSTAAGFVEGWDWPLEDPALEPFLNWDLRRGDGRGYFLSDRTECASRRVDLRGPTDLDPGPLPMEEATDEAVDPAPVVTFDFLL